jgi:hypothetical protein
MTRESQEAVLQHNDYFEDEHRNDPLQLFLSIRATHPIGGGANDEQSRRTSARHAYQDCKQGPFESIVDYKTRFNAALEGYTQTGNVEMEESAIADDFKERLDNVRYTSFKADLINGRAKGDQGPQTLNAMFHRANDYVVVKTTGRVAGGAAFATRADLNFGGGRGNGRGAGRGRGRNGGRGGGRGGGRNGGRGGGNGNNNNRQANTTDQKEDAPAEKRTIICYNCDQEGHKSYECPNEFQGENGGQAYATRECSQLVSDTRSVLGIEPVSMPDLVSDTETCSEGVHDIHHDTYVVNKHAGTKMVQHGYAMVTTGGMAWSDVLLDNQADISVVHPRLLSNVRRQKSHVCGLSGTATLPYVGDLDGFFECKGSSNVMASVLCMSDVEDMYDVTYVQGESYTVHMEDRDLVFRRRDKLYVADMSEWDQGSNHQVHVTTVQDNEAKFPLKEVKRAKAAYELVCNAGFTSERQALGIVNDGNISGVTVTANDVRRAFELYGKPTAGVRGRRTAHRAITQKVDRDLKSPHGEQQVMTGDIAYFNEKPYLMCVTDPLGLITVTSVVNTKTATLGSALHTHIATVQSRGFIPTIVHLDPQPGFTALDPNIPGVEIDIGGAGDHVKRLDVEIRHTKEIFRSVLSSLPWQQPQWLDKDLVNYCVSRRNLSVTSHSNVSPRVKFTGRKPDCKKELGIGYGDYCEVYDPKIKSTSSGPRTEPCIALCPTGNANGSWIFLSLRSKRRVRRSNWEKMVTTELVIDAMNEYSRADTDATPVTDEDEDDINGVAEPLTAVVESVPTVDEDDKSVQQDEEPLLAPHQLTDTELNDVEPEVELPDEQEFHVEQDENPVQSVVPPQRESARVAGGVRRPKRYQAFHTSVKRGLQEHGADAYKAIVAELRQLLCEKKALVPVHRGELSARQLKRAIRSLMFLKTKFDGLGRFEKIKARLVANGKQQDRTLYPDTYSPTVALQSVLMCLTIAAAEGRQVCAVDIGGAYLNADRTSDAGDEIIMELEPMLVGILAKVAPEIKPYVDGKGRLLVKLSKAMYGTLDAAKIWYEKLTGVLRSMGFVPNSTDPCVYNKIVNGQQCTIVIYVDDLLITCIGGPAITEVVAQLESAFEGDIKSSRDKDLSYLGMHLKIEDGRIIVSMTVYLKGVLEELKVTGSVTTPATAGLFKINPAARALSVREAKQFHTTVAKLLYLSKRARVDILLAVAFLTTRVKAPTTDDAVKLDRVLKYLNGTADQVLVLQPTADMKIGGYIDASFGCHGDGKSHTGLVVTLGGCTVLCMSSKQKLVTRDSTEAELVALSDKLMCVVQCYDFVRAQGITCVVPEIYQDNTSTITLVTKGGGQYRTKYMRVRQAFVHERSVAGEVSVIYTPTGRMLADVLTKPLQGAVFRYLSRRITGR